MIDFPKYYKQNSNKTSDINIKKNKKTTNKKINLARYPLNIGDSLDYRSLFKINTVDFFCKYYNFFGLNLDTSLYSYFHNKSAKPIENKTIIKQKKEIIKFIRHFNLQWDFEQEQTTLSEDFTSNCRTIFSDFVKKGIIKECYNTIHRSNNLQTVISNDDIINKDVIKKLYTVKYFISTKNNSLDLNIFDLELIFADVAIAIHPSHKKAKHLKGKEVIIPITNRKIPIIIDERADFGSCGGIRRVTPGHDPISLDIAKDHNLPVDVYAFDEKGYFTEYAGTFKNKKVEDFLGNIEQNLSDIGNLIDSRQEKCNIILSKKTGEKLVSRSYKGWFLETPDIVGSKICISSLNLYGTKLPVRKTKEGKNIIIDESFVLSKFTEIGSKKQNAVMSVIIFNLIADGYLDNSFGLEDLIEVLLNDSSINKQTILGKYISILDRRYNGNYKKDFESLQELNDLSEKNKNTKDYEIIVDKFMNILLNTFCINYDKTENKYLFEFTILDKSLEGSKEISDTFNDYFLNGLLLLSSAGTFVENNTKKDTNESYILFENEQSEHIEKYSLIGEIYNNNKPRTKTISISNLIEKSDNKVSGYKNGLIDLDYIKKYGSDSLRLNLLTSQTNENNLYDQSKVEDCYLGISTFWNCCRYIKTTLIVDQHKGSIDLKDIKKILDKNMDKFNAFDIWLISKIKIILQEFMEIQNNHSISDFGNSIIDFIKKDFSNKYLELIKANPSDISNNISLFVVGIFIKLLYPYIPDVSSSLWNLMEFKGNIEEELPTIGFDDLQKNYLISLFMELVDKFLMIKSGLNLKKHSPISMFIKSNQDFIKFTKSNEQLLKKTLHAEDIQYLTHQDHIPDGYINQEIIDITIGLKEYVQAKPKSINSLQKLLEDKQEYLQNLKVLLNTINSSGVDSSLITQKRQEIESTKEEIENLIFEINKLKIKE